MLTRRRALVAIAFAALGVASLPAAPARSSDRSAARQVFLPIIVNGSTPPAAASELSIASSAAGVVVRWQWLSQAIPAFRVYRTADSTPESLLALTDPALAGDAAIAVLDSDPRWPGLYEDLRARFRSAGVTDVPSLRAHLQRNRAVSLRLETERYPVALFLGTGILDQTTQPGVTYGYRVEPVAG